MPTTTNHNYDFYEVGDDPPWSHENLIRSLDTDVEIRKPGANRLNYQPKAGAKFFATDSGRIHIGTGTAWRYVGTVIDPENYTTIDAFETHVAAYDSHAGNRNAHHAAHEHPGHRPATSNITLGTGEIVADYNEKEVPQSFLGGPAASLSAHPLVHGEDTDTPADAHHARPTAGTGLAEDQDGNFGVNIIDSGSVTLSGGEATVDTGVATSETATFQVPVAPTTADAAVTADVLPNSASGTYHAQIRETTTAIGTVDVEYDIVRVR